VTAQAGTGIDGDLHAGFAIPIAGEENFRFTARQDKMPLSGRRAVSERQVESG